MAKLVDGDAIKCFMQIIPSVALWFRITAGYPSSRCCWRAQISQEPDAANRNNSLKSFESLLSKKIEFAEECGPSARLVLHDPGLQVPSFHDVTKSKHILFIPKCDFFQELNDRNHV